MLAIVIFGIWALSMGVAWLSVQVVGPLRPGEDATRARRRALAIRGGALWLVLLVLYYAGTFDRMLAPLGLNYHECARNGYGATYCGSELARYREQVDSQLERPNESTVRAEAEEQERRARECTPEHEAGCSR